MKTVRHNKRERNLKNSYLGKSLAGCAAIIVVAVSNHAVAQSTSENYANDLV